MKKIKENNIMDEMVKRTQVYLKRLGRAELIDIIIELQKENTVLTNENKKLTQMLNEKNIILNNAGSIAEASLKLNKVFETAQAAADQYVESVKSMAREEIREYMKRKIDG